jgi:predicted AlkP superfamily pyrophosphatase or phosphodiesterase
MVAGGLYATGVHNALPTVTYPNHTTLVTGVWPARHGIGANVVFDPLRKGYEAWDWYSPDIRVPTLWDAVHAQHKTTASLGWPVSVDNASIDQNLPEYWRARTPEDAKLLHALSTPGLPEIAEAAGFSLMDIVNTDPSDDEAKARAAAAIYAAQRPYFFTLHLSSLDHYEHLYAPGSPEAYEALHRIDAAVAGLVAAARKAEPDLVVVIVSDHGFAPISHAINLDAAFVDAGLITLDDERHVKSWQAASWVSGGSAAVVLADPKDEALRAKVAALLQGLADDPNSGVGRVLDKAQIAAMGGTDKADFFVDAKIGYEFGTKLTGPLLGETTNKGTHGYFPDHPEMRASLIIDGVSAKGSLGDVDMRDIAPTVAQILGVSLSSADGHSLLPGKP